MDLTLETKIEIILDRDRGVPYESVLDRYDITHQKFSRIVKALPYLITQSRGKMRALLKKIHGDTQRRENLFFMGEECIKNQYARIISGKQLRFYHGIYNNYENIKNLVYHGLIFHHNTLGFKSRTWVVKAIQGLPRKLYEYLRSIRLTGIITSELIKEPSCVLAVIKLFDQVFQEKTGRASLFNRSQKHHLHEWEIAPRVPPGYWNDTEHVEDAVYHVLGEYSTGLQSENRKKVIDALNRLPKVKKGLLRRLGFGSLMICALPKGKMESPLEVIMIFDRAYCRRTGDASLFDLSKKHHLHEWELSAGDPHRYWENKERVKQALLHILMSVDPVFRSRSRKKLVRAIQNLHFPTLRKRTGRILVRLMHSFKKGEMESPLKAVKLFDAVYQEQTGRASLFDLSEKYHIHEWEVGNAVPKGYWKNKDNVKRGVFHILGEHHPELTSRSRKEIITCIKAFPVKLQEYFSEIGVMRTMAGAFGKGTLHSPLAVIEVYDKIYRERTGDTSLFSRKHPLHLEYDRRRRLQH